MCIRTTFSDFGRADAASLLSRESGFLRVKKSSGKKNLKKRAKSIRTSRDCFRYWLRFFLLFFSFLIPFVRFVWKTVSRPISCRKRTRGKQMRRDIIIIIPFFFFFCPRLGFERSRATPFKGLSHAAGGARIYIPRALSRHCALPSLFFCPRTFRVIYARA